MIEKSWNQKTWNLVLAADLKVFAAKYIHLVLRPYITKLRCSLVVHKEIPVSSAFKLSSIYRYVICFCIKLRFNSYSFWDLGETCSFIKFNGYLIRNQAALKSIIPYIYLMVVFMHQPNNGSIATIQQTPEQQKSWGTLWALQHKQFCA